MSLASDRVVFFDNSGQAAVKYNFDGRSGPVTYVGPGGKTIATVADYSDSPNLTQVVFYASGAVQQYTTDHADGSNLTLLFADTAGGKPSVTFGANNDLSHGELLSSTYFSPHATGASSPTPFRVYETFSAGHLTLYDVTTQDTAHVGLVATFAPNTQTSKVTLTTVASSTPLVLDGAGPIDALVKLQAASVISNDGAGIISHDGGGFSLIGQDGGGLVAAGGGNLSILSSGGTVASIISHDGGGIVSHDAGGIVSHDAGGLLDLLNISSLITQDGGGLVATNAGVLVAAGGGNLAALSSDSLVAAGGGNFAALTGAQLLASDATRLISNDGAGLFGPGAFAVASTVSLAAPAADGSSAAATSYGLLSVGLDTADATGAGGALSSDLAAAAGSAGSALQTTIFDLLAHFSSNAVSSDALRSAAANSGPPDLKITTAYLDRSSADAGGTVSVSWQVQNAGTGAAAASTSTLVLSKNATLGDSDDVVIASLADPSLGAGRAVSDTQTVTLPATLTPGTYFLGVVANGAGQVAENGANNFSRAMAISVPSAGTALAPDFVVSAAFLDRVATTPGSVVNVSYQIKNAGTASAGVSHSQIYLHAANGATPDLLVSTLIDPALPAGNAVSDTVNVTLPPDLAAGTYYLTVVADGKSEVSEAHEANNASAPLGVAVRAPTQHEVLFASGDDVNGYQLWSTDGTATGAKLFKTLVSGYSYIRPSQMAPLDDGRYLMIAGADPNHTGLWITDGTVAGTTLLKSGLETGGTTGLSPSVLVPVGGARAVFLGQDATHGQELWVTDGTSAGTQLVKDINPGAAAAGITNLTALGGGKAVFTTSADKSLWVTDGTAAGTMALIASGDGFPPSRVTALGNGKAVFSLSDGTRNHIYVTDGTVTGTVSISDAATTDQPDLLTSWVAFTPIGGGYVLFAGTTKGSGEELWVTNGTRTGTHLLADLNPAQTTHNGIAYASSSSPEFVTSLGGGKAFVAAHDVAGDASHSTGSNTYQLFYVDAAAGTAKLVTHIGPDEGLGASGATGVAVATPGQAFGANLGDGRIVFAADDGVHGVEPWVSDGTAAGTHIIKELNTQPYAQVGDSSSYSSDFQSVGDGKVMFRAAAGGDTTLWITDGTATGTYTVNAYPLSPSPVGDVAVFDLAAAPASQLAGYATQTSNLLRAAPGDPALSDPSSPLYTLLQAEKAIAAKLDAGSLSGSDARAALYHLVDGTTSVAEIAYAFFTGKTPTGAGLNYLVHSDANPSDLNDAYYAQFSTENRYINFASNLGRFGDATTAAFHAAYDNLSLADATAKAYQAIFGTPATADKVDLLLNSLVPDGLGGTETRAQYFAFYGTDGLAGIGTKAAMIGWLLSDSVKEGFGTYEQADLHFLQDLAQGSPTHNVDLLATYNQAPALVGQPGVDATLGT